MSDILFFMAFVLISICFLLTNALSILFRYGSIITKATITTVEEKEKYYDDTDNKRLAYDYAYEYTDLSGVVRKGRITKNTPRKEYRRGEQVEVIYLKSFPRIAIHKQLYDNLRFLPLMTDAVMLVLLFILFRYV